MRALLAMLLVLAAAPALADSSLPPAPLANQPLPDPAQEAMAKALMETLRCLQCQSQSIADSNAEMASDMRALVRERIARGEQPEAIRRWLIDRYGDWVSFSPPVEPATWPLWAAPLLFVAAGGIVAAQSFKRRRRS